MIVEPVYASDQVSSRAVYWARMAGALFTPTGSITASGNTITAGFADYFMAPRRARIGINST